MGLSSGLPRVPLVPFTAARSGVPALNVKPTDPNGIIWVKVGRVMLWLAATRHCRSFVSRNRTLKLGSASVYSLRGKLYGNVAPPPVKISALIRFRHAAAPK